MHQHHTEAIRLAEHLLSRIDALSGAGAGISAAARANIITPDEIYHLLDVIAADMARSAQQLLAQLTASGTR
ncbi:MAG: hypothetical protein J0I74_08680 [Rhodanobacter sp.]|jgi:hypothetical protein|nr:hypothetical protein [Rhodanobacter sp.]